jgi:stage II sporulation protein M
MATTVQEYAEGANLRRWTGRYFLASALVFWLGIGIGIWLVTTVDMGGLRAISEGMEPLFPDRLTVVTLAINNLTVLGIIALGTVSFGVITMITLFYNGVVVGLLLGGAIVDGTLLRAVALIVPHGWLELSMFWLVGGLSLRVTHRLVNYLRRVEETPITRQEVFEFGVLLLAAALGIVLAAWIEAQLTITVGRGLFDAV